MGKIVMIATSPKMEQMGEELKKRLKVGDNLQVCQGAMDHAVKIARSLDSTKVDAIICRGASGRMLEQAGLDIPIVDISISDEEVIMAVNSAREMVQSGVIHIAYIGFIKNYRKVKSYLDILNVQNIEIIHYDVNNIEEVRNTISHLEDNIDVIIGGNTSYEIAKEYHKKCVLLAGTMKSLEEAYNQALALQKAIQTEKNVSEERRTIINLIREGVVSIDREMAITLCNSQACRIFKTEKLVGMEIRRVCPELDKSIIDRAFLKGEASHDYLLKIYGDKYLVEVKPVCVEGQINNVILFFQEIDELQKMETTVRKKIYLKGNVAQYHFEDIKGVSPEIRKTIEIARVFAKIDSSVLLLGDTGTGKELFAQSIHNASKRADGPFVAVNCGAIPSQLMESELFGYTDGAFTGAKKGGKTGLFEQAHRGTIFLDEISEMDLYCQVMLLRILQERQIRKVGGDTVIPIDVRIIAACNVNLEKMVSEGQFRKDLYYRLSVLVLNIPELNARQGDIKILADYYFKKFSEIFQKNVFLGREAHKALENYKWKGNVRQLASFCERAVAISPDGELGEDFIREELYQISNITENSMQTADSRLEEEKTFPDTEYQEAVTIHGKVVTKKDLQKVLRECKGNRSEAARQLDIGRMTLYRMMKKLGLYQI